MQYVRYTPDVEVIQPHEAEQSAQIAQMMHDSAVRAFDRHRHAIRDAHAKQHGTVVGTLHIYNDLPVHLAQGLFSQPRSYPVVIRFSSAPGELRSDELPSPHGMAIKVIGVEGPKLLEENAHDVTQDFLLVSQPVIPFGTVNAYLKMQQLIRLQERSSELAQKTLVTLAEGGKKALGLLGIEHPLLNSVAAPDDHLLGQTYHSMAALRFGEYIAKISAAPQSASVEALVGQPLKTHGQPSAKRDAVVAFFAQHGAEYELRAQLCTDLDHMPVEDGSVLWEESRSPHQPIAKLIIPAQDAYSPSRRVYSDDHLSFNPWHGLLAHQPLGSIMRIRKQVYASSAAYRHQMNVTPRQEPRSIEDVPA